MLKNFIARPNNRLISILSNAWSGVKGQNTIYSSKQLTDLLKSEFPNATALTVEDVSGGCGAMFEITVEDLKFKGIPIVKQHRMITEVLKKEIKEMHGLRIHTSVPQERH